MFINKLAITPFIKMELSFPLIKTIFSSNYAKAILKSEAKIEVKIKHNQTTDNFKFVRNSYFTKAFLNY